MQRPHSKIHMPIVLATLGLTGTSVLAQDAGSLEEVVVTATKRSEPLRDVPIAVSAIKAEDITARGLTQYADYLSSVPGVQFQDAGPGQSRVLIRGIVANEGGGGSASVATYFGETVTSVMNLFGGKPNLRLVDVDRIEVLRGPQGTLFGANALSGVVRIVPAAANLEQFEVKLGTRGFTTAHSDDASYHVEGAVNIPLIDNRLAVRVVAYKDDIAGFIDNVVPAAPAVDWTEQGEELLTALTGEPFDLPAGTLIMPGTAGFTKRDVSSEDTWGARVNLVWPANDQLKFDLTHAVQDVTTDGQPYVDAFSGRYAQRRALDTFVSGKYVERLEVSTLVGTYEWDAMTLTSASNFATLESVYRDDLTPFVITALGAPLPWEDHTVSEGEVFTQEVRLQSTGDAALQWLVGAFYLDQQVDVVQSIEDFSCPTCIPMLLFGETTSFRSAPPGTDPRFVEQEQRSIFGEISYRFAERWTVGVGGRYLEEDMARYTSPSDGFLVAGPQPAQPARKGTSEEFNPSAYVRFKPNDDWTLYVQAARGFRSAQTNSSLAYTGRCEAEAQAIGLDALTDPDTLWSYELGVKSLLADGRVGVNAAVYKQRWEGVQLPIQFDCGFGGVLNGGDVDGRGLELEVSAQIAADWSVNLAGAYTDNEFDTVKPGVGFERGERPPGAPEKNASAGVQYDFSVTEQWSGFARADYSYVGEVRHKFGQVDPVVVNQGSYGLTNLRVGVARDELAFELFGRNITDERAVVNTTDPALGSRQYLSRPREIGVEVRYSFR